MQDLLSKDATDQLAALRAGQVGAAELLGVVLERVERLNPTINAVVTLDVERAMAEARAADAARARGEALGPLAGLPMTVKDNFDIEGLPASLGLRANLGRTVKDAEVVARVRAAGAIVWGQTNVPAGSAGYQAFNAIYGVTRNPWDLARTPGGSSGGSAAALAAGFTALEIGADIGGSIRVPASFCGVAGHKPSWGLVPQRGMPAPPGYLADYDLIAVGPMARSVRDLQLMMRVLADVPAAPTPPLDDLKIGVWLDEPSFPLDAPVRTAIADFATRLQGYGAAVEEIASPLTASQMLMTYMSLLAPILGAAQSPVALAFWELLRGPAKLAKAFGAGPLSWAQGVLGYTARHHEWLAANEQRARLKSELASVFERHDVILSPAASTAAFVHDHAPGWQIGRRLTMSDGRRVGYLENVDWIVLATLCDLPATVIPVGLTPEGLPIGVQIIGRPGADAATLAAAAAMEAAVGGFRAPPL